MVYSPKPHSDVFCFKLNLKYRNWAILRSKSQWYNKGEKNTKYFLNLEKRHFKQGTISQLKINDIDFVTFDKAILIECESFYKHLYTSKISDSSHEHSYFFQQVNNTVLSHEVQKSCQGLLSEKECLEAVKKYDFRQNAWYRRLIS